MMKRCGEIGREVAWLVEGGSLAPSFFVVGGGGGGGHAYRQEVLAMQACVMGIKWIRLC